MNADGVEPEPFEGIFPDEAGVPAAAEADEVFDAAGGGHGLMPPLGTQNSNLLPTAGELDFAALPAPRYFLLMVAKAKVS